MHHRVEVNTVQILETWDVITVMAIGRSEAGFDPWGTRPSPTQSDVNERQDRPSRFGLQRESDRVGQGKKTKPEPGISSCLDVETDPPVIDV